MHRTPKQETTVPSASSLRAQQAKPERFRAGTIRVLRKQIFVSNTLQEDPVGLEEVDDGVYDLHICFYQIGRYEVKTNKTRDVVSRVGVGRGQVDLANREAMS